MIKALLTHNIKSNYKIFLIFLAVMTMYSSIIIGMYDPDDAAAIEAMMDLMPEALMNAMNFTIISGDLIGFIGGYYYGFIIVLFPMIFTIILSFKLMGKIIDDGSIAFILSTPHTRKSMIITQISTLILNIFTLLFATTIIGMLLTEIMFAGLLDIQVYILLNVGAFLLFFAIGSITFFCSTVFNEAKNAIGLSIAVPVGFFIIDMLASVSEDIAFLRFFSIFTLYDNIAIVTGEAWIWLQFLALLAIGIFLFIGSTIVFLKKDLTI